MSAPWAPQGAAPTTWSPPSSSAISSDPSSPSSGGSTTTSPPSSVPSSISIIASPPPPAARAPGCAACKHKRQKCPPGCVLLPYFPASEPDKFRSVLRVFGVKNLLRTLREVPRPRWDACVRTVVYESRARLADPVRGCVGAIEELEGQLMDTAVELVVLRRRLQSYRQQAKQALNRIQPPNPTYVHGVSNHQQQPGSMTCDDVMQPQGPYGTVWSPAAMAGLTAPPPQFFAMQPQFPTTRPQLFSATPPQVYATQPQFSATQPQLPAMQQQPVMCRQPTRGASTPVVRDGFGDPWANDDDRGGPDDM